MPQCEIVNDQTGLKWDLKTRRRMQIIQIYCIINTHFYKDQSFLIYTRTKARWFNSTENKSLSTNRKRRALVYMSGGHRQAGLTTVKSAASLRSDWEQPGHNPTID